jgi:hypothetical protein
VVLVVFLLELLFLGGGDALHVFFVQEGNFLYKCAYDVPNVCYPAVLFKSAKQLQNVVQEKFLFNHLLDKEVLCYVIHIADQSVFVYLGNAACFLEHLQRSRNQFREHFEALFEDATDHLLAIDIKDFL